MLKKLGSVIYGMGAYLLFLGVFLYLIAFVANVAPYSVSGRASMPPLGAALIDVALVAMFGLQHSIMARPAFKRMWTQVVPRHLERSTFVWFADVMVILLIRFWQPIEGDLWNITGSGMAVLYAVSLLGWLTVPVTTLMTGHSDLFGLRQVLDYALGRESFKPEFRERALYKKVRHPMMLAILVALWATPHLTWGHLLLASLMTAYILTGIYFEERDLERTHGQAYRDYQSRVPKLLPLGERGNVAPDPLAAKAQSSQSL
jgi:methanethiol S-methyltransferase